jgi:hypothetical protein
MPQKGMTMNDYGYRPKTATNFRGPSGPGWDYPQDFDDPLPPSFETAGIDVALARLMGNEAKRSLPGEFIKWANGKRLRGASVPRFDVSAVVEVDEREVEVDEKVFIIPTELKLLVKFQVPPDTMQMLAQENVKDELWGFFWGIDSWPPFDVKVESKEGDTVEYSMFEIKPGYPKIEVRGNRCEAVLIYTGYGKSYLSEPGFDY